MKSKGFLGFLTPSQVLWPVRGRRRTRSGPSRPQLLDLVEEKILTSGTPGHPPHTLYGAELLPSCRAVPHAEGPKFLSVVHPPLPTPTLILGLMETST